MTDQTQRVVEQYQEILAERFPGVVVRLDPRASEASGGLVMDAFCVPDGGGEAFMTFVLDDLSGLEERLGLGSAVLIPHSESATRMHYSDVCKHEDFKLSFTWVCSRLERWMKDLKFVNQYSYASPAKQLRRAEERVLLETSTNRPPEWSSQSEWKPDPEACGPRPVGEPDQATLSKAA